MSCPIAIVGMACIYPDARTPAELWENVLAQRRAFRRIPDERLRAADYLSADVQASDKTYVAEAAVIEGYEFDRVSFRVVGSTFRSADLAHWLALDVASQALADAGYKEGQTLPRETTGVVLGNTLTGEFSRANLMRLRWPYVRRVLETALTKEDWTSAHRSQFLDRLEADYKAPFPPVGDETLAGGLSNTIAGRICNQFDLKGGGYTVDGACASSLLAVANACSALAAGDLDVALAGGVDLSLDPFELVGFAKVGALAPELMRVYDTRSAGFWPGEGCGFAVLMRQEDAIAEGRRIYAVIQGWGISSDGSGGITRPEVDGQLQALRRAYRRAGYGIDSVEYFEGHGTGTNVGDATELKVLSSARRESTTNAPRAAIGSIKGNIGHTKAAAGIAGLLKAALAVHAQVLPPTTGCETPHPELKGPSAALRILGEPEPWPADRPLRAAVSAMGFGGMNTHVTLEGASTARRQKLSQRECALASSVQDSELFLFEAADAEALGRQVDKLLSFAARLSYSDLADLAAELAKQLARSRRREVVQTFPAQAATSGMRAAVIASTPAELAQRLETLNGWLLDGVTTRIDFNGGLFLGCGSEVPRFGFLFPGQGSPAHVSGGLFRRRFAQTRELYDRANLPSRNDGVSTDIAQPAIVTASLAGLELLNEFGVAAHVAVGHSLGEITALHWAGAFDQAALLRIVRERGRAMADLGSPSGAMAAIAASASEVSPLVKGDGVSIVGFNSPRQTVIAGETGAIGEVIASAEARGLRATRLPVSHAFHTPLVAAAAPVLAQQLSRETILTPQQRVVSTITGAVLRPEDDLRELLCRQVTSPVRFIEALTTAAAEADLWIEVGPGEVLTHLARDFLSTPTISIDAGSDSLRGLWRAVGAAFVLGAPVNHAALFTGRFTRPFNLDWKPKFFVNPCELAPVPQSEETSTTTKVAQPSSIPARQSEIGNPKSEIEKSPLDLLRQLVAERAELPASAVSSESRLLGDLHLNSISVGQLVAEAAKRLGLPPLLGLTDFANATVGQVAAALEELRRNGSGVLEEKKRLPAGVDSWLRAFMFEWVETPPRVANKLGGTTPNGWQMFALESHPLKARLGEAVTHIPGVGVVVCLPIDPDESQIPLLLDSAKAALAKGEGTFVLVQHGRGAGSFARTLHLEAPRIKTCVIDVPFDHPQAMDWILQEAAAAGGHSDVHYDASGVRWELVMKHLPLAEPLGDWSINSDDVLLVTGGGKGIAAECALMLGRKTGAQLALLGRSQPSADAELDANLERIRAAGVRCRYFAADVTNASAVRRAVLEAERELGPVTAFLHAAGTNVPQVIGSLDEAAFRRTLAPKFQGARNVLAAIDAKRLRLFVTFGSIIGRAGLHGEADYAVANEWLTNLTEEFQAAHPSCRCLAAEWSVWSGVGMGARLGRIESLRQQGITPISPEAGVEMLERLLRQPRLSTSVVVTGRFGDLPTIKLGKPELPFLRFLEQPRVFYPGVELVVDSVLSSDTDPYVEEHVYHGERLFPAVMGLEAMAQAAMALMNSKEPPIFENVELSRPVVVPRGGKNTIRVAALVRQPDVVEVALRCEQTGFQADHFRATCRFANGARLLMDAAPNLKSETANLESSRVPLDPARDLYDRLLFHTGRFRRVLNYRLLRARECAVQLEPYIGPDWFGRYLPQQRVLGCGAVRDAAIHAIQACIPHARLLPIGVQRIVIGEVPCLAEGVQLPDCLPELMLHAREVKREGDTFHYDLELLGENGAVLEKWEGLRLRKVEDLASEIPWPEALLGPYVERRLEELLPGARVSVAVERAANGDDSNRGLLGTEATIRHRADGKPELAGDRAVSVAHASEWTLTVTGDGPLGCDLEPVVARPLDTWSSLLGAERFRLAELMAKEEELDAAATRVWTAIECLKKAGSLIDAPLVLSAAHKDGWVVLQSGQHTLATCATSVGDSASKMVVGILAGARFS